MIEDSKFVEGLTKFTDEEIKNLVNYIDQGKQFLGQPE